MSKLETLEALELAKDEGQPFTLGQLGCLEIQEIRLNSDGWLLTTPEARQLPEHQTNPEAFAEGSEGHILGQKLNGLLRQLTVFTYYADATVAAQLQDKINFFWELGEAWEKETLKNLKGEPSDMFESIKKTQGIEIFAHSESKFKTYIKNI